MVSIKDIEEKANEYSRKHGWMHDSCLVAAFRHYGIRINLAKWKESGTLYKAVLIRDY